MLTIQYIKEKLHHHPFFKNIMVLVSGSMLGFIINFLFLPMISRIYLPEQMGEYDLILSSGRFAMEFISLGLIIAIMLPKEDKHARQLCQIILVLNLFFLTFFLILFLLAEDRYTLFHTSVPYRQSLGLLAAYLFFYNIQSMYYSYTNRLKAYQVLFWNPLILSVSNVGISVGLGLLGMGTRGYLLGTIFSYMVCIIHMHKYVNPFLEKVSFSQWKKRIADYKDIIMIQMPANMISQLGNEIPTQYLGRVFGAAMLGGYTMATKISSIPVSLLATPVNRVVYQTMAERVNRGEDVGEFCFHIVEKNIKIALIPVGILIIFGEKIIPFFLGDAWKSAGEYMVIMGIMYLLRFCSSCVSGTFVIMGWQKVLFALSFVNLAKYGICFGISYCFEWSVYPTVLLYALFESGFQIFNLALCVRCTKYSLRKFGVFLIKYIVCGNLLIYGIYFVFMKGLF